MSAHLYHRHRNLAVKMANCSSDQVPPWVPCLDPMLRSVGLQVLSERFKTSPPASCGRIRGGAHERGLIGGGAMIAPVIL